MTFKNTSWQVLWVNFAVTESKIGELFLTNFYYKEHKHAPVNWFFWTRVHLKPRDWLHPTYPPPWQLTDCKPEWGPTSEARSKERRVHKRVKEGKGIEGAKETQGTGKKGVREGGTVGKRGTKWKEAGKGRGRKNGDWRKKRNGWGAEEELEPWRDSGSSSWPEMLIQRFNKSMPLEKYNVSPHWVDVRGLRKCIRKYFTLRGNNVLIYNSSPYTLGLSICVSDLTS